MGGCLTEHKGNHPPEIGHVPMRWQSHPFGLGQIDNQTDDAIPHRIGVEDAQTPRLDHAGDGGRAGGNEVVPPQGQGGPVIGNKLRAQGHEG